MQLLRHLCFSKPADLAALSKIFLSSSYAGSENKVDVDSIIGSVGTPTAHRRSDPVALGLPLINPFSPQRLHFKVTANQRRWSHAFMTGGRASKSSVQTYGGRCRRGEVGSADGFGTSPVTPKDSLLLGSELRARHSRRSTTRKISESSDASGGALRRTMAGSPLEHRDPATGLPARTSAMMMGRTDSTSSMPNPVVGSLSSSVGGFYLNGAGHRSRYSMCDSEGGGTVNWGTSSIDREWSAQPQSTMDWKSLAYPPSLPLTTDFFPDRRSLENDYVTSEYTLLPEDMCADLNISPDREKITAALVYNQMLVQRLAQNFQIVLPSKPPPTSSTNAAMTSATSIGGVQSSRKLTGSATVGTLDLRSRHRSLDFQSHCCQVVSIWMGDCLRTGKPSRYITNTNLAFHLFGIGKSSICLSIAGVMAGRVHLCNFWGGRLRCVIPYGR